MNISNNQHRCWDAIAEGLEKASSIETIDIEDFLSDVLVATIAHIDKNYSHDVKQIEVKGLLLNFFHTFFSVSPAPNTIKRNLSKIHELLSEQKQIMRLEDRRRAGDLLLQFDESGGIFLQISDSVGSSGIQFFNPTHSGEGSPNTYLALMNLFVAMCMDQSLRDTNGTGALPLKTTTLSLLKEVRFNEHTY